MIEKQVLTTYINLSQFSFLATTPVLAQNVRANENFKVDTHSQVSNSGPYDYEANALPHDDMTAMHGAYCTNPYLTGVSFISIAHNILLKTTGCFPTKPSLKQWSGVSEE